MGSTRHTGGRKTTCRLPFCLRGGWAVLLGLAFAVPGLAQEVQWRHDYNSARKEAVERAKPLLLDFGTENCFWCKKLDASTFRDPAVAGLLNERFVPLKIDATRDAALADLLRIHSYPTLVLAAADGKILGTLEGFQDAPTLYEQLRRVLVAVSSPDWMTRDYQEAVKAVAASDIPRAVALLKTLVEDGQERPVQVQGRQLLQDLERQAADRLAQARTLEQKGQPNDAAALLTEVQRQFMGTRAAAEAGQMLTSLTTKPELRNELRNRRARELLAQAREDYRAQQYLCCLDRCEALANGYMDLLEGAEALQLAEEIKNNPEWMQQVCEGLTTRLGNLYLAQAESWLKKGQPQQAVQCLERVLQACPGTRQAEAAQSRLGQIQGRPLPTETGKR